MSGWNPDHQASTMGLRVCESKVPKGFVATHLLCVVTCALLSETQQPQVLMPQLFQPLVMVGALFPHTMTSGCCEGGSVHDSQQGWHAELYSDPLSNHCSIVRPSDPARPWPSASVSSICAMTAPQLDYIHAL